MEYEEDSSCRVKIIVVGNSNVGKTSLISQYSHFQEDGLPNTNPNLICEAQIKKFSKDDQLVYVDIWDTVGQERFQAISTQYYKRASGAMIVYSIEDQDSFNNILIWIERVQENCPKGCKIMLIGNKADLNAVRSVTYKEGFELSLEYGIQFFEVSAKTGHNITENAMEAQRETCEEDEKLSSSLFSSTTILSSAFFSNISKKKTCKC
ncbi:unnamed protein product [Moneuplotes crassus]|uniref:Uncharacterized protein n=1 Tax=Euplotes crassus TaxID=5936 RepID=A0AAD1XXR6_EUPCR|nr:unnamed protein product [Moneuplotes crassus]